MRLHETGVFQVTSSFTRSIRSESLQSELVSSCPLLSDVALRSLRRLCGRRLITHFRRSLVWLACTLSFILGLPSLGSAVAFAAATSIATIGLYISYGTFVTSSHTCSTRVSPICPSYSNRTPGDQSRYICSRTVPPWGVFLPRGHCGRPLDHVHLYRIHASPN